MTDIPTLQEAEERLRKGLLVGPGPGPFTSQAQDDLRVVLQDLQRLKECAEKGHEAQYEMEPGRFLCKRCDVVYDDPLPAILEDLRKSKAAEQAADREVQRLKEENEQALNSIGAESWTDAVAIFKVLRKSDEALGRYADRLRSAEEALRMFLEMFGGSNPGCDSPILAEDAGGWEGEMAQCGTCFGCCLGQLIQNANAHFSQHTQDTEHDQEGA